MKKQKSVAQIKVEKEHAIETERKVKAKVRGMGFARIYGVFMTVVGGNQKQITKLENEIFYAFEVAKIHAIKMCVDSDMCTPLKILNMENPEELFQLLSTLGDSYIKYEEEEEEVNPIPDLENEEEEEEEEE